MKKNLLFLTVMLVISVFSKAQDIITPKKGDEIKAKVVDITETQVKYKKFENVNGPTYTIEISSITSIKYENGTIDKFDIDLTKSTPLKEKKVQKKQVSFFEPTDSNTIDAGFWGVNLGLSLPTNDFGSKDKTSQSAGRASNGSNASYQFNYQFGKKKRHGIILQYLSQSFERDNAAYSERLSNIFGLTVINSVNKGKYNMNMFGIGHNIRWKLNYKNSIALRYIFSYSSFTTPGVEATFSNGDKFTNSEGKGSTIAFSLGLHYKNNITNSLCFLANIDNTAQTFKYNTDATLTGNSNSVLDNSLSVSNYNFSVGFGFRIQK